MTDELERLRQRVDALETIEREYLRLKQLIDAAASNRNLDDYGGNAFLYVYQSSGRIVGASPKSQELLGFNQTELCALHIHELEIGSHNSRTDLVTYVQNAAQEQVYRCDYQHRDGYRIPMRVYCRVFNSDGGGTILQYTLEDISLRKTLWNELKRREDRGFHFREKLKYLNEINLQLAEAQSFHALCEMAVVLGMEKLGFDRLSIWFLDEETQSMVGTYGVDETGTVRDERRERWSYADTYVVDFIERKNDRFVINDNAPIYNHVSQIVGYGWHIAVPLLYQGRFIGFMTADNFINQLKMKDYQPELLRLYGISIGHLAAHQRERDTVLKLSNAIQHSTSIISILNEQATIEFVNSAFLQVSGFSGDEVLGKSLSLFLSETEYQPLWQAMSDRDSWHGEIVQRRKNGDPYETIVSLSPIQTGNNIHSFVLVQEDITELKASKKHEFELRLEQARVRMLETFIRDIGHEFKTPLSIIRLKTYLAQKTDDSEKYGLLVQEVQQQVDVINTIVDDLIYIVKLESEPELKPSAVDLKKLVDDVAQNLASYGKHKPLQWNLQLFDVPSVTGDPQKLRRAVHEVIRNAVQYTPENGSITITLCALAEQVMIRIQDTGIGIAQEEIGRIFNRLYRVDQARTERGTGLGLSIAKLIVEAHGGEIRVESSLPGGSTFDILLPIRAFDAVDG